MQKIKLGTKQEIDVREIWEKEDTDFTPWLAKPENIQQLGSKIGMDLIVLEEEKEVGPFRADILCQDEATENLVLIENQLEKTDHKHLGQLLTYATGLNAASVVWIASDFNEEHRATLDWLNKITDEKYNFFGIKISGIKIDDKVAPDFTIVSKPNDWTRSISSAAAKIGVNKLTETNIHQLELWSMLCETLRKKESTPLKIRKPFPKSWHVFPVGRSGVAIGVNISTRDSRISVDIYIHKDQSIFEYLEKDKKLIETEFGEKLDWQPLLNKTASRIAIYKSECRLEDKERWSDYINWYIEKAEKFYNVFSQRIKNF